MSSAPTCIPADLVMDARGTWDVLEQHLIAFAAAWQHASAPPIADHLPGHPALLRKLALVELIKIDLEHCYAANIGRLLEDYAREFPDLCDELGPPCDLIFEEYHVRRSHGHAVVPADYFIRFPGRREELSRLLGVEESSPTMSLFSQRRAVDLKEGDQIDDFDLLARLGKGAFGSVYLARQRSISRLVALKVSADRGQEARTLAQLDHPNIVRVYDQRRMPERKLRLVYMQLASGGTLSEVIERIRGVPPRERSGKHLVDVITEAGENCGLGPMADPNTLRALSQLTWPEVVCRIGTQLALALDYAHKQGVLHRDVKPANILLAADGTPKLADFNISALSTGVNADAAAYFGGSLVYMSPEHLEAFNPQHSRKAEDLDGRADLYSLAVVLWELLTGQRPFQDVRASEDEPLPVTLVGMTNRRRAGEVIMAAFPGDDCAKTIVESLIRALSPDREERPQNGAELARELSICSQAETRRLVRLPKSGWREWVRRWPVAALLTVVTVPNLIAAIFNGVYNYFVLVKGDHIAEHVFFELVPIVNGIAFPLGAVLVLRVIWPVAMAVKRPEKLKIMSADELSSLRLQSLRIAHWMAMIGIIEWVIAGMCYPTILHLHGGKMTLWGHYPFFIFSLALCGVVGAAYPYLGASFLAVRVFFPTLLPRPVVDPAAEEQLRHVGQRCGTYFVLACGIPLVGLGATIWTGIDDLGMQKTILATLTLSGIAGLITAFKAYSVIRQDTASLSAILRPVDTFGSESSTKAR